MVKAEGVTLEGLTIAFLVSKEGIEQVELTTPWEAVLRANAMPRLISPQKGTVQAFRHLDKADTFTVDETAGDADANVHVRSRDIPSLEDARERIRVAPTVDHTRSAIVLSRLVHRNFD